VFSEPFLVEMVRGDGRGVVAVCRSYRPLLSPEFFGLESIQRGITYDSADADLAAMWTPVRWQPMPTPQSVQ
jgi:hypothetical protein